MTSNQTGPARAASRFFVGIGAQKAGTSWLWTYLMSHPEVGFSPVKELHFFDSKHTAVHAGANREIPRIKASLRHLWRHLLRRPFRGARMAAHYLGTLFYSTKSYRAYLEAAAEGHAVAGEFTPSYTMLDPTGIAAIERALDHPRYLLVLRNPADRFWSHVRFRARWHDDSGTVANLAELLGQDTYLLRSGYARIWRELAGISADGRLHALFFEDLFDPALNQPVCDLLCDFLQIAPHKADPLRPVNPGDAWPEDRFDRAAVVQALAGEYRFFARIYGTALPASWRQDLAGLDRG